MVQRSAFLYCLSLWCRPPRRVNKRPLCDRVQARLKKSGHGPANISKQQVHAHEHRNTQLQVCWAQVNWHSMHNSDYSSFAMAVKKIWARLQLTTTCITVVLQGYCSAFRQHKGYSIGIAIQSITAQIHTLHHS